MKEETKVLNLVDSVPNVATQVANTFKSSLFKNIGIAGAGIASGAASGGIFLGLTNKSFEIPEESENTTNTESGTSEINIEPLVPDLNIATMITTEMSFEEAFAAAREEVGAGGYFMYNDRWYGTYYAEEWANMTAEEKTAFSEAIFQHPNHEYFTGGVDLGEMGIIIHDVAPIATWVNDDMPITDAHVIARMEVGPGGIFLHDGKTYSTYYPSELAQMNPQQHQLFIDSIERADVSTEIQETGIDVGEIAVVEIDTNNLIYDDTPDLQAPVSGEIIEEGFIDMGDGMVVYGEVIDTDDNGIPDVVRLTDLETNETIEMSINEDSGEIVEIRNIDSNLTSYDHTLQSDFDPNADMNDWA